MVSLLLWPALARLAHEVNTSQAYVYCDNFQTSLLHMCMELMHDTNQAFWPYVLWSS